MDVKFGYLLWQLKSYSSIFHISWLFLYFLKRFSTLPPVIWKQLVLVLGFKKIILKDGYSNLNSVDIKFRVGIVWSWNCVVGFSRFFWKSMLKTQRNIGKSVVLHNTSKIQRKRISKRHPSCRQLIFLNILICDSPIVIKIHLEYIAHKASPSSRNIAYAMEGTRMHAKNFLSS